MNNTLWWLWLLLLPGIVSGILHMVIVTRNYFPRLAIPVHQGWFGSHKTWRGFIVVPTISTLVSPFFLGFLNNVTLSLQVGFITGLGYMLFELPNSALKRRLGIAPGKLPSRYKAVIIFFDQLDSGTGIALGCMLTLHLSLAEGIQLIGLFIISAMVIKNCLYLLALKKSRF